MTEKEKADCFIELHKEQLGKFKQTRDIEFKVNIALWTLIVVASKFIKDVLPYYSDNLQIVAFIILAILIICGHLFLWMVPIQNSEDKDDHYVLKYRHLIEQLCEKNISLDPGDYKNKTRLRDFKSSSLKWIMFEVGITTILLTAVGIYLFII